MLSLSHKSLCCTSHCWGQPTPPAPRISAGPDLLEPRQPHGAAHMGVITRPNPAPIWYPSTSSTTATAGYSTHTHTHKRYHRSLCGGLRLFLPTETLLKTTVRHPTNQRESTVKWTEQQRDGKLSNSPMTSSRTHQHSQWVRKTQTSSWLDGNMLQECKMGWILQHNSMFNYTTNIQ